MYEVGAAIQDITAFKGGIGMMGYGMHFNVVHDIETPLYARAFVFRHVESGKTAAIVVAEMAFVTISVKRGVLKRLERKHPELGFTEGNLLLSAQHTHSGPGGYSHYGFYNITVPGFVPEVYQGIVDGITAAIVEAHTRLRPAQLFFDAEEFAPDVEVAFNRSIKAHMANPEALTQDPTATNLGIDREMKLLRMVGMDGEHIGAINWFGVHTTSVHNDNHSICWDNKGYAAQFLEGDVYKRPLGADFVGAFAQGVAGDVTPNYIWDKKKKWTRGLYENDFESAKHNGRLQYELAKTIYDRATGGHKLHGDLDWAHIHVNFANVQADPAFTNGVTDARTDSACHGVSFFAGTTEGPGMPGAVKVIATIASKTVKAYELLTQPFRNKVRRAEISLKYKVQGRKTILFETGARRVLGTSHVKKLIIPAFADPTILYLKTLHPRGWEEDKPWVPHVLPLQILVIGDLAFVAVPAEPTTVAGIRIRKAVEEALLPKGIHRVIVAPYANAYCGYITTNEEYQHQFYEGGHTVYGQWTLAAFQTKYHQLAMELSKKVEHRDLSDEECPPEFTAEEINRRIHGGKPMQSDQHI